MKRTLVVTFGLVISSYSLNVNAKLIRSVDDHLYGSHAHTVRSPAIESHRPEALVQGVYAQSIDHFGQMPGKTFNQRYWVDTEYAANPATAPVIYHICGEGDVEQAYFLQDSAITWAQQLGANLVYLEHRYYGQSLPFPDLSSDHLQFLTLNNVIEDLASFEKWIITTQGWKGPWISVGGSYSGTLSAIYRLKHPELVNGALASSAPMISGEDALTDSPLGYEDLSSTDPSSDTGSRQWVYEACRTFGFWESDGVTIYDPSPTLCQSLFGGMTLANSTAYNQAYYQPFVSNSAGSASNVFFTYGSADVWTKIGLSQSTNPNISLQVIQGAGHHFDLNPPDPSDSQEVLSVRAKFITLAKQWLGIK